VNSTGRILPEKYRTDMAAVVESQPETPMNLWLRIRDRWTAGGVRVPPGATPEALSTFEQRYSVVLPRSMRDYFQTMNGSDGLTDDDFEFWPLERVKLVSEEFADHEPDYPQCFLLADYAIWCFGFAIHLGPDAADEGPVYIVGGREKIVIAGTFFELMQKYDDDPASVM
jgi:SMI1/KNR4 family protein SUKH-1